MSNLLERYHQPAPRYTSYPPIPNWGEDVGAEHLVSALNASARPLSIYVHIPFCEHLCLYCGCNVLITRDHTQAEPYLKHLVAEMDLLTSVHGREVTQVHWGGGSPTFLSPDQVRWLLEAIGGRFPISPKAEVSIEIDPRVTTLDHLRTIRRSGFNRLSIGIQDFDPAVQRAVNRVQPYEATEKMFREARDLEFESINVDLIYGLPFQTPMSFQRTIDQVLSLDPDRIALFSYAHVPSLKRQQKALERHLPPDAEELALFKLSIRRFTQAGYDFIGMDHFARSDDPLSVARRERTLHRNFQGYTTHADTDLLAFGISSISAVGDTFTQNHRDLLSYGRDISEGNLPIFRGYVRTEDDRVRGTVVENILCNSILVKAEIEDRFSIRFDEYFRDELQRLEEFATDGLVTIAPDSITVENVGRIFIRTVAQVFDAFHIPTIASRVV
jgi:oxygen-independent coproporphyrinogen-3 oxidase